MKTNKEVDEILKIDYAKLEIKETFDSLKERDVEVSEYILKKGFNLLKERVNEQYPNVINTNWESSKETEL